jgi:cysteinyl-tRNA synthetase
LSDNLGITPVKETAVPEDALNLKTEREAARRAKDWKKSDELRARLTALGYKVEDNPNGTSTLLPLK